MKFHALPQQPFSATLTPARESGAAALRAHAGAKTVLVFPGPFRTLQGAFHGFACRRGATLGTFLFLSTAACNLDILLLLVLLLGPLRLRARARARVRGTHMHIAHTFTLWNKQSRP